MICGARFAADELDRLGRAAANGDRAAEAQVLVGIADMAADIVYDRIPMEARTRIFEDVLGDILLETVRAVRRYGGAARLSTFIYATVSGEVRKHHRRYGSRIGTVPPTKSDSPFFRPVGRIPHAHAAKAEEHDRALDLPVLKARAETLLFTLDVREREVIRRRFGLFGTQPETLVSIAARLDLCRERVRQIEQEALYRLGALAEPPRHRR